MCEFLRDDDQLFKTDLPDIINDAIINSYSKENSFYADGYRTAADTLVKGCLFEVPFGRGDIDILIYPIIFNYRHYIELRLKEIVTTLRFCYYNENVKFKNHSIKTLWNELTELYKIFEDENHNVEDFSNTEKIIFEFDRLDPSSMTFRYPTNKDGNKILIEKTRINIRNLREVMERLANFLDSLADFTSDRFDHVNY